MLDLRTVLVRVFVERAIVTGTARLKCPGCDVVLQELAIDNIDDGGDECFDIFGSTDQGFYVIYVVSDCRRLGQGDHRTHRS